MTAQVELRFFEIRRYTRGPKSFRRRELPEIYTRTTDATAAKRKFARGERIAPLGESRFPEQFQPIIHRPVVVAVALDVVVVDWLGPSRREASLGRTVGR